MHFCTLAKNRRRHCVLLAIVKWYLSLNVCLNLTGSKKYKHLHCTMGKELVNDRKESNSLASMVTRTHAIRKHAAGIEMRSEMQFLDMVICIHNGTNIFYINQIERDALWNLKALMQAACMNVEIQ